MAISPSQLQKMSPEELKALVDEANSVMAAQAKAKRLEMVEKFKALADEAGMSLWDMVGAIREGLPARTRGGRPESRLPPRYANPEDPTQKWSGRGGAPSWMREHIAAGGQREDLAIGASAPGSAPAKRKR